MSTVLEADRTELAVMPVTPMTLIDRAAAANASIEQMQQLLELQIRWEENEARKAYNRSFSAFKAEAVRVTKNVQVTDGPLKGKRYADLFGVCDAVIPALSRHDLSHAWKLTKDEPAWMEVTCTITHADGHSVSTSMGAAPDTGPGRNAIQARASAKSYLERYTLLAATGMAAAGTDDDGAGAAKPMAKMHDGELTQALGHIAAAETAEQVVSVFQVAYRKAQEIGDQTAMADLIKAKNERKQAVSR